MRLFLVVNISGVPKKFEKSSLQPSSLALFNERRGLRTGYDSPDLLQTQTWRWINPILRPKPKSTEPEFLNF
jgi:hypothetical protein